MAQKELDFWWSGCTDIWMNCPDEIKQKIHDHCNDIHGLVIEDWSEGTPQSY